MPDLALAWPATRVKALELIRALCVLVIVAGSMIPCLAAEPGNALKVLSYNVWNGFTEKPEPRRERWRAWMAEENPDVVSLQELKGFTLDQLRTEAMAWGHSHVVLLKEDGFPTGLTSSTPITEVRRIRDGMHHGLLRGRIRGVYFYVIHFHPSHYGRRIEEARHLKADIDTLPEPNPRIVLVGDFNGFSPADQFHYDRDPRLVPFFEMLDKQYPEARNLNGRRLDYGGIEEILKHGFVDLAAQTRPSSAPFVGTFPTELRRDEDLGTDRRLDYIFVSPNLARGARYATVIRDSTTAMLSDHYPLVAELGIP
jgi:endonuclease/exonuclease/phosphatase family metal-dependent hydrolase